MKRSSAFRTWAPAFLFGALVIPPYAAIAQSVPAATQSLLDKAHALEVRGRMDMAAQTWQQVLLADPNNTEALGGLARAAKLSGNVALANTYLDRLRAIDPNDPGIARVQALGTQADNNALLKQAGRLAQQGNYAQAMAIYRKIYGATPPPGDMALAYYETESATEEGRPNAIAGLRGLSEKYPTDSRYQVTLGRILTYNPKTRAEGRKLLSAHPYDPAASEALRQSLLWDSQNPATASDIRSYLAQHPDAQLSQALRDQPKVAPATRPAAPMTAEQKAEAAAASSRNAEDSAAYRALNGKHLAEAEQRFKAILAKDPNEANALAGMGYVRMQQANFGGAISYIVQAQQNGSKDPGLTPALATSRFWNTMAEGAIALNDNDLVTAEKQYRAALTLRPASPEALEALGGTLLRAQQPDAAAPYFVQFIKVKPAASHAWRGLFLAQVGESQASRALETARQMPASVRAELMKDPLYLRSLASAYTATGRDAEAQQVLRTALELPFPADAHGVEAETQLQFAGLLQQANHLEQAAGLYRQVLAKDPNNVSAWQGLVRVQHAMGQDETALETLESMPEAVYARSMRDSGFESTVASIYQTGHRLDVAQDLLEKSIAQQTAEGQKASVPVQIQLAGIYLERGSGQQAYPIYRQVLTEDPERLDAWKGLVAALHSSGHDAEALAQVQVIPQATRSQLESDPEYLQTVASVYNGLGQPQQAAMYLRQVEQHYAQAHVAPPADVDIQNAWLEYNSGTDAGLYKQLLALGSRNDLTEPQRRTVQTIWANWAVRRANQSAAKGQNQRAIAILNATARAFPDNPGVIKALAGGYSRAGMYKQAVAIWKAQNLTTGQVTDYRSAVGAALAANDQKDAETWLRFGLEQFPKDPDLLILGAKFEQQRGDTNRAADYYRASLSAMPPVDPGAELATELSRPVENAGGQASGARSVQDLATLLAPNGNDRVTPEVAEPAAPSQPYLPGYGAGANAPVVLPGDSQAPQNQAPQYQVPQYMGAPASGRPAARDTGVGNRLKDYVPQAAMDELLPAEATALPTRAAMGGLPSPIAPPVAATHFDRTEMVLHVAGYQQVTAPGTVPLTAQPASVQPPAQPSVQTLGQTPGQAAATNGVQPAGQQTTAPAGEVYGPYVPYKPPPSKPVDLGANPPAHTVAQPAVTDVLPKAKYVPNSRNRRPAAMRPEAAAAAAAAARRQQSVTPLTGESRPPAEEYKTAPAVEAPYNLAGQPRTGSMVSAPAAGTSSSAPPQQTGDSYGQQYPQPQQSFAVPSRGRSRGRRPAMAAAPAPTPQPPVQQGLSYPGIGQPLSYQPYPTIGPAYPLGTPPTDADLIQRQVPPLRGNYYTGNTLPPPVALTPRQQAERDLETLEASYSGWLGGTGSARYRSGTVGLDRLTDLETTMEASVTVGNRVRFTVVPRAVFLNSGALDTTNSTTTDPVLGTLPGNAANAPAQQFTNGVGGELQVAGRNFAAAVGYTPYEFLVRNVTGRLLFKPTQHVTLYANRDSVTQTQLSYAGLRDPGSVTPVFAGNIWGGVIQTGGGLRFDYGDERAGFYLTADGADITGYHVLENTMFEGSAGAYFLAHSFPGYGRLNVGASLFGMHYAYNERGMTYGLGGYFSPNAYFLASIPVTFTGRYGNRFHYTAAGSVGVQTFQESSQIYYPLDAGLQNGITCTNLQIANGTCGRLALNSNTGGNYSINSEGAYRIAEHWFAGGFLSANNTNNYNTVTAGFFVRYLFRPQYGTDDTTTGLGLFPVDGFRPLRVP